MIQDTIKRYEMIQNAQWGAALPTGYLQQDGIAYDGNLPQVYLQKFISLFFS
jgi:hypothetical protein